MKQYSYLFKDFYASIITLNDNMKWLVKAVVAADSRGDEGLLAGVVGPVGGGVRADAGIPCVRVSPTRTTRGWRRRFSRPTQVPTRTTTTITRAPMSTDAFYEGEPEKGDMRSGSEPDEGTPVLGRPSVATEVEEAVAAEVERRGGGGAGDTFGEILYDVPESRSNRRLRRRRRRENASEEEAGRERAEEEGEVQENIEFPPPRRFLAAASPRAGFC